MDRPHEPGCDGNHTDRQRCNGVEPIPEPPPQTATTYGGVALPPRAPINPAVLICATVLEFLPIFAVFAMFGIGWLHYLSGPEAIDIRPVFGLLFLIVFFGSGAGWFLAGVPAGGCAALVIRFAVSVGVVWSFLISFEMGGCDWEFDSDCSQPNYAPLFAMLSLWVALTPLSAVLLFMSQRSRISEIG